MPDPAAVLREHLPNPVHAWSIGTYGAIAEFTRDPGEATEETISDNGGTVVTPRGALRIDLASPVTLADYESRGHHGEDTVRTIMFCIDEAAARQNARTALTEIGPDDAAIAGAGTLFDMGLGAGHVDVCVRTEDAALTATLRAHAGKSIFDPDNPAMAAIKNASPTRVFISCLGRIEIYQPIGSTAKGIPTPEGPHTHVLPKLLRLNRTHARNAANSGNGVPDGMVPALNLYPAAT